MTDTPELDEYIKEIDWEKCPEHIREGMKNYVINRISTGGFLHAVLVNDLFCAIARADETNKLEIHKIIQFIHNELPTTCYGSQERYLEWLRRRQV